MSTERQTASTLEGIHWAHKARYEFAAALVQPTDRVLDIGCGNGYGCSILAAKAAHVVGLDIAPEAINQAKHDYPGPNIEHILCDCNDSFKPVGEFELVTAFEVLEHVEDALPMLKMAYAVLVPGGKLVSSMPNGTLCQLGVNYTNPYHKRHYTSPEYAELLERAGFYIDSVWMQWSEGRFYTSAVHNLGTEVTLMIGGKRG